MICAYSAESTHDMTQGQQRCLGMLCHSSDTESVLTLSTLPIPPDGNFLSIFYSSYKYLKNYLLHTHG